MPARVDLTNRIFGQLSVLGIGDRRSTSGNVYWRARCSCGTVREFNGKSLRIGHTRSCGCKQYDPQRFREAVSDLAGSRFGKLTAVAYACSKPGAGVFWRCLCECGREPVVRGASLTTGATTSCGCYRPIRAVDLMGKVYGLLTVIKHLGRRHGDALWACSCRCGNSVDVIARSLVHGKTTSCGCRWQFRAGGKSHTLEYRATKQQEREARKRGNGGLFTHAEVEALYGLQRGCCAVCREPLPLKRMHRDHIVPISAGGDSSIRNIQLLCAACNGSKHAKDSVSFMQAKGFLL